MYLTKIQHKKAAIELSIGTVVIIVLAMSMLILGIILIRGIFTGAIDSVNQIDQGVKNEINKLFSENSEKKLILYPDSKIIKLEKGSQDAGFAISIRNLKTTDQQYTYRVSYNNKGNCPTDPISASGGFAQVVTGQQETINIPRSAIMQNPRHVRIAIDETAPSCTFSLNVDVYEGLSAGGPAYESDRMDIEIKSK